MTKLLATVVAATIASFGLGAAQAADPASSAPALNHDQAKNAKTQANAQYKAKKDVADANEKLNKANCDTANGATHGEKSACKDVADAQADKDKAEAKLQKESDQANIKANSK
jgi:hypothetical protein